MKSTLKILFADDDFKYSLVLKRFLEREGYEVTYTGNGTMALKQFPVVKPDLVLLDINMPGLNGFEVAEKIREQDRHVLIFFLSDRSDKNDRLKGFSLRGNDYLAKPFYPEELIARIKDRFEIGVHESVQEESFHFGNTTFNYTTITKSGVFYRLYQYELSGADLYAKENKDKVLSIANKKSFKDVMTVYEAYRAVFYPRS